MINEEKMVEWVINQFETADEKTKQIFLQKEWRDLIVYHNTLGKAIRNEFKLWDTKWEPDIEGKVDHSPMHPDAISHRVITKAWKILKDRKKM